MKMKRNLMILSLALVMPLILGACTAFGASSWPGLSADPDTGTAYVAYNTGIYAINTADGSLKWTFPDRADARKTFFAAPILTPDGQLVAGGYDKTLHSLDPATGVERWSFNGTLNRFVASPAVTENRIFAPSADERMYALNMNGEPTWDTPFQAKQALWGTPVYSPERDVVYLAGLDRNFYAVRGADGSLVWASQLSGASVSTPAIDPETGVIYLGTFAKEMLAIDPDTGDAFGKFLTEDWVWEGPTFHDGQLYFGDMAGNFYAMNVETWSVDWRFSADGPIASRPLVNEDILYFGTENGTLYALDLRGNIIWNRDARGAIYGTPVRVNDLILVALLESDNLVVAYDTAGNLRWSFAVPR
jgi:eukaryotic-like serine/threonine-protein kinase